ncbi:MAG: hypothetical protein OET90_03190 [Desulfuromonadales bacterium]|nr:hypothetical protein [Desulfuromonadales bacterium]
MRFDVSIVVTWILFIALFPMAFIWLRRAWRIFIKHNYSEVALKRGEAPPHPEKWAVATGTINLLAGGTALVAIVGVVLALFPYKVWSSMAGITLWMKVFADYIVSRQAHPFELGRKKETDDEKK